jgi:hypothetical protein
VIILRYKKILGMQLPPPSQSCLCLRVFTPTVKTVYTHVYTYIYVCYITILHVAKKTVNPLTPELNSSAQRCFTRFLLGILLLEPYISLIYARKTNKIHQLFIQFINYVW